MEECFFENKHLNDLNPLVAGQEKYTPMQSCGPEIREYYTFIYVISGKGFFRINHVTHKIRENMMFIIPPDTIFYFQADNDNPWEITWICFDGEYANKLSELKSLVIEIEFEYFENLIDCRNYPSAEAYYLSARLWNIFSYIFNQKKYNYVTIATDYINKNYSKKLSVEYIAKNIGIDRRYLAKLFKESTGQTIKEYIIKVKMIKARFLLINYNYNVKTVSIMVGYDDEYAFSKVFKKYYGHAPGYYKNMYESD